MTHKTFIIVLLLCMAGCASERKTLAPVPQILLAVAVPDTIEPIDIDSSAADVVSEDEYVKSDSLIGEMLEVARQHYMSATTAQANGDSLRASIQFEQALSILNELSYAPEIENNRDFNDLSKAVIDDYGLYIAKTDTLNPESSVFALREKLNQITEISDTLDPGQPKEVAHGTTIPLVMNRLVEQHISFFQGKGREHMERWLHISGKYFPILHGILRQEGVPEEIAYLAMVESGLNPRARSWARAVGMWQFMKGTGSLYGLASTPWFDERRDF